MAPTSCGHTNRNMAKFSDTNGSSLAQILGGCLKETLYEWPEGKGEGSTADEVGPLKMREEMIYCTDDITYINSKP